MTEQQSSIETAYEASKESLPKLLQKVEESAKQESRARWIGSTLAVSSVALAAATATAAIPSTIVAASFGALVAAAAAVMSKLTAERARMKAVLDVAELETKVAKAIAEAERARILRSETTQSTVESEKDEKRAVHIAEAQARLHEAISKLVEAGGKVSVDPTDLRLLVERVEAMVEHEASRSAEKEQVERK